MKLKSLSFSVMVGLAFGLPVPAAMASGYHFGSQSVSGQGASHANSAEAGDASVLFYNPAGMSLLDGTQFSGGLTFVIPDSSYTDHGSTNYLGQSTGSGNGGTYAPDFVVAPSFYLTHQLNDRVHIGLGMFVPYGAKLDYGGNWAGRYSLEKLDMKTININPSISFKLDDRQSLGFGVSAQYMDAELVQGADAKTGVALLAAKRLGLSPTSPLVQGALASYGISGDGTGTVDGDDWGFGWNVGYMFKLDDRTRFGLAYRSKVNHTLKGTWDWDFSNVTGAVPNAILTGLPILGSTSVSTLAGMEHPDSNATVKVVTPESASANFFHELNDKIDVMGDLTWTRHSRLNEIRIQQSTVNGVSQGDLVINQQWKNTYKLSLGMNYHYSDNLLLRTGVAYDQSPVKNDNLRHPALPDSDRYWFSVGANYKLNKQSSVDLAYSYVYFKDGNMNYTDSCNPAGGASCTGNGETTKGEYKTNLQIVGMQYNYHF
ncbi:OmpP1/FadL family transporter [Pseudogulbenkiania subflava]|uniref:Long-chain fatty acid transport protein n=1 Tax=Pseudogulbenkiania subflava DSM 22618 TaxID=1123014 RepID=A0A1Y6C0J1_9NEIS|nr:OmpP1/FadL family transporter [Pseudogulbenkiania subflava]SMF39111.1 long-chain fatty acid transport protein [Pseudogulbenkiania subflava DSM 22618]